MVGHWCQTPAAGFTLVEVMVVIGILVLLAVIAVPAITGTLAGGREKQTLLTMGVLEGAISEYKSAGPAAGVPQGLCDGAGYPYSAAFGRLPPSPLRDLVSIDQFGSFPECAPSNEEDEATRIKFGYLVEAVFQTQAPVRPIMTDMPSVECLVLFLERLSPRAQQMLEQLPDSVRTNRNRNAVEIRDGERVDLFEIRDAWGNPLRYAVRYLPATAEHQWELRSGGQDAVFAPMFSDGAASGDDVVLRGN